MGRWRGTVERVDLGPGLWVLRTEEGDLPLEGDVPKEFEGERVAVDGRRSANLGIGMTGEAGIVVLRIAKE